MARCGGLKISGNDTIALFGQGPVGLSTTQLAAAMRARRRARYEPPAARARQGVRRLGDGEPALELPNVASDPRSRRPALPQFDRQGREWGILTSSPR
jgi:hypothetical protein